MTRTDTVPAYARILVALLGAAVLAACGPSNPGTKGGSQGHTAPTAVITPIGYAPAPDGTITVRSGALIVLSGKDSTTSDDPILGYSWTPPVDPLTQQSVPFLTNTSNSITFFAPNVPAGMQGTGVAQVTVQVGLKITTASGLTSTASYTVHVVRASDEDDFLLSDVLATRDKVQLKLVAAAGGSGGVTSLAADLPFTIHVNRHVLYRLRGDAAGSPPSGDEIVERRDLPGQWLSDYGIVGGADPANPASSRNAAQAAANPRFVLRPPVLSEIDVNLAAATATGAVLPAAAFDISAVNDAEAEYEVTLTLAPGAATPNVPLALVALTRNGADEQVLSVAVGAAPGAPVTLLLRRSDILAATSLAGGTVGKVSVVEDASSALAYVAALDPAGTAKDTLDKWLRDNCFDPAAADFAGDIHAVYTNNFDLGFGRDMHFKTDCTAAQRSALGATINTAGGERAAVVVNFPSLESAAKHVGGFLAVAMEYRLPPCLPTQGACSTTPIVSFWTFAQDPVSGVWKRVISADFDGRGQHYTPGNCTVCHGGRPKSATDYATTNADLGAMFLPWDSKSLLFADTDPSFKDDTVRAPYVKSAQMPNIRALNLAMAGTLSTDLTNCGTDCSAINGGRKVLRDLATGWGNGTIDENYVPDGWANATSKQPQPCGASGQPACVSPAQLYSGVVAQHCRSCHLQRVAEPKTDGSLAAADAPSFADYSYFTSKNFPILIDRVYTHGVMPASRLTSDRFWVGGSSSPAATLASHLGLVDTTTALNPVAAFAAVNGSGTPLTVIDDVTGPVTLAPPGTAVRFTARDSAFASAFSWSVSGPADPLSGAPPRLSGGFDMEPAFVPATFGRYPVTLTVTDATGLQSSPTTVTVAANSAPVAAALNATLAPDANSVYTTTVDLLGPTTGVTLGDGINIISVTGLSTSEATVSGAPGASRACPAAGQPYYDASCVAMCLASDTSCALRIDSPVTVTVNYRITDESPSPLPRDHADSTITATNPINFQAGSGAASAAAWRPGTAGTSLDLASILATSPRQAMRNAFGSIVDGAQPWSYTLAISTAPSARGRSGAFDASAISCGGGPTGSASAGGGSVITYVPPAFFVSNQGGVAASGKCNGGSLATDSLQYTISAYDGNGNFVLTSKPGTITLTVNPTPGPGYPGGATYANVYSQVLFQRCTSCHLKTSPDTPPQGANWATPSQQQSFLDLVAPVASPPLGLASAGCPNTSASDAVAPATPITDTATPHCIELGDPSGATPVDTSLLYTKPQGINHGGDKVLDPAADKNLLQLIRDWLLDGAYNN